MKERSFLDTVWAVLGAVVGMIMWLFQTVVSVIRSLFGGQRDTSEHAVDGDHAEAERGSATARAADVAQRAKASASEAMDRAQQVANDTLARGQEKVQGMTSGSGRVSDVAQRARDTVTGGVDRLTSRLDRGQDSGMETETVSGVAAIPEQQEDVEDVGAGRAPLDDSGEGTAYDTGFEPDDRLASDQHHDIGGTEASFDFDEDSGQRESTYEVSTLSRTTTTDEDLDVDAVEVDLADSAVSGAVNAEDVQGSEEDYDEGLDRDDAQAQQWLAGELDDEEGDDDGLDESGERPAVVDDAADASVPAVSRGLLDESESDDDVFDGDGDVSTTGEVVDLDNDSAPAWESEGISIVDSPDESLSADAVGPGDESEAPTLGLRENDGNGEPSQDGEATWSDVDSQSNWEHHPGFESGGESAPTELDASATAAAWSTPAGLSGGRSDQDAQTVVDAAYDHHDAVEQDVDDATARAIGSQPDRSTQEEGDHAANDAVTTEPAAGEPAEGLQSTSGDQSATETGNRAVDDAGGQTVSGTDVASASSIRQDVSDAQPGATQGASGSSSAESTSDASRSDQGSRRADHDAANERRMADAGAADLGVPGAGNVQSADAASRREPSSDVGGEQSETDIFAPFDTAAASSSDRVDQLLASSGTETSGTSGSPNSAVDRRSGSTGHRDDAATASESTSREAASSDVDVSGTDESTIGVRAAGEPGDAGASTIGVTPGGEHEPKIAVGNEDGTSGSAAGIGLGNETQGDTGTTYDPEQAARTDVTVGANQGQSGSDLTQSVTGAAGARPEYGTAARTSEGSASREGGMTADTGAAAEIGREPSGRDRERRAGGNADEQQEAFNAQEESSGGTYAAPGSTHVIDDAESDQVGAVEETPLTPSQGSRSTASSTTETYTASGSTAQQPTAQQPAKKGRRVPNGAIEATGEACPAEFPIKGNANSHIYHLPGESSYEATKPEYCFSTEAAAKAAGYRPRKR